MANKWYYWHDAAILGPFTPERLADLALAERILPTDTVWKDDIEAGIPASQVKHLFPASVATPAETVSRPAIEVASAPAEIAERANSSTWDSATSALTTTRRAVAGKGAVIVGQDGTTVKYLKKCTTCGREDSSYKSLPITRGMTRVSYFCPKCRKTCAVEIHGHVS